MYILASDLFEKDDKYVFKTRNLYVCREFVAFKYVLIFSETNQMIIYICTSEILKTRVLNRFSAHNIHLYLC